VLLFADDLGYGDVGYTGHPSTHTPNLNRWAFSGKIFTSWYSGCAVCSGSRAALLTGRRYVRIGVDPVFEPTTRYGLSRHAEITVAQHLKLAANYSTAIVGNWHLGQRTVYLPANHGFDSYLGIPYSDDMGDGNTSSCPHTPSTEQEGRGQQQQQPKQQPQKHQRRTAS
jgi:arylsulfatase A